MEIGSVELESLQLENIGSWPSGIRTVILIILFIATLVAGYFFDLTDIVSNLDTIIAQRKKLESDYAQTHHIVINLDSYREQVEKVKSTLALLSQQIPPNSEEALLLEEISQQASSSGLHFLAIKPLAEERKGFYVEQPLELTLEGDYQGFSEFISHLSSLPRIVTTHDFTITKNAEESKSRIVVNLKTYWASEKLEKSK